MDEAQRGRESEYDAALNTIADHLTVRDVDFAEAGNAAQFDGLESEAFKNALRTAGFPESSLDQVKQHVGDEIDSAMANHVNPLGSAIRAIREAAAAFPPNVYDTSSFSVEAPDDVKKALLDVFKASHNFWPRYANAMYHVLKQLEDKPHSKVLDDMLANGPPPRMAPYRDIDYPYRRGNIPGPGMKPVPVKPGQVQREFVPTNLTTPWFCRNRTSDEILLLAEAHREAVANGLQNLNSDQDTRDSYLARLRNNQDEVRKLANAVPNTICRLRIDPSSLSGYQTPKTKGHRRTSHALLRLWKSVLESKANGTRTPVPELNYCANLTSKKYSEAKVMSKQSLYESIDKYAHVNKSSLQKLARDDHDLFHWMRTWSVPIVECKLQLLLKSPTNSTQERAGYQNSLKIMRDLEKNLDDINEAGSSPDGVTPAPSPTPPPATTAVPQNPMSLPELKWPWKERNCPHRQRISIPEDFPEWDLPDSNDLKLIKAHFLDQVLDHAFTFVQRRDDYLKYVKTHIDQVPSAVDAVNEAHCLTRAGVDKGVLQDLSLALREILFETRHVIEPPATPDPDVTSISPPTERIQLRDWPFCPDFRQLAEPRDRDRPRFIALLEEDGQYRQDFENFKTMALESMDLFNAHRDKYLQHMRSHPDQLATTLRMLKDMDCTMFERVDQEFSDQKKSALSPFFDSDVNARHYASTLPAMVKALEEPIDTTKPTREESMSDVFDLCHVSDGVLQCPPP